ncbi:hypothetical protein D3C77_697180 [compost metagenome]
MPIEKRVHLTLDVDDELKAAIVAFEQVLRDNVLITDVTFDAADGEFETADLGTKKIRIQIKA